MGTHTAHGTDRISHRGTHSALALRSRASSAYPLTTLEQRLDSALVAVSEPPPRPRQLSWNGVRVSDELQRYAASVARGEALAPYRGPVLARSEMVFPWNLEATPLRAQQRRVDPPWSVWQLAVLTLLFAGVVLGGSASLLADSDGADVPLWSTQPLEPRIAAPAATVAPTPVAPPIEVSAPRPARSRARAQQRTVATRGARATSVDRTATSAAPRLQPAPLAVNTPPVEDNALFVEAPSF